MSKLYDFLERLKKEQLEFRLSNTDLGYISVEIDAFSEKWIVDFDAEGLVGIGIYRLIEIGDCEDESLLKKLFSRVQKAWLEAANDLDFEVIGPHTFRSAEGERFEASVYLPDFGGPKGTVLFTHTDDDAAMDSADEIGFYQSALNPLYYDHYDRENFIETLQDWGWMNPKKKPPAWYKEKPEQDSSASAGQ